MFGTDWVSFSRRPAARAEPPQDPAALAKRALTRLDELLGEEKFRGRKQHVVRAPEVRKTLELARDRLVQLGRPGVDRTVVQSNLARVIEASSWLATTEGKQNPTEEQAWALADGLRSLWIDAAPVDALKAYLGEHPLRPEVDASALNPAELRLWLLHAHDVRRSRGAHERARASLRLRYLQRVGRVLWLLVLVSLTMSAFVFAEPCVVVLSALFGAVGGTLSGARALRGSRDIREARAFQGWWWVQPSVGGAVGLFIYALLASGVLSLPGSTATDAGARAAAFVLYAFAAGFSEPFVLGLLSRITGAADAAADATANPPIVRSTASEPPPTQAPRAGP